MRQRTAAMLMAGLLMTGGGFRTVSAMTYVSVDFPTLVGQAHAIAVGRVVAVEPRWREGRRGIETALTLEVVQYLKGDLGRTVTLNVPGGQMGRYRSVMPGAPAFTGAVSKTICPEIASCLMRQKAWLVALKVTVSIVVFPPPIFFCTIRFPDSTYIR